MGVDFTALMDHNLDWAELYLLPERLNQDWDLPEQLIPWVSEYVRFSIPRWKWQRDRQFSNVEEELFEANCLCLDGPHGFQSTVFKSALEVSHLCRWWSFLHETDLHLGLREAVRTLASIVRAKHILYLPDSGLRPSSARDLVFEGQCVQDALKWLHAEVGQPLNGVTFDDSGHGELEDRAWFYEVAG
jgi:hypothetical protein